MQQPFRGEAVELVMLEFRDMRQGEAEQRRRCGLRQALVLDDLVHVHGKLHAQLAFRRIGAAQIAEYVAGARVHRFSRLWHLRVRLDGCRSARFMCGLAGRSFASQVVDYQRRTIREFCNQLQFATHGLDIAA